VTTEVRKVGVVGLGTMGAGIAQVCVQAGVETVGREVAEELGQAARERIAHYLARGVEKGRLTGEEMDAALARLTTTTELADLSSCDLVIEGISMPSGRSFGSSMRSLRRGQSSRPTPRRCP
jgi:3-hydroxybutyryl-CoA dehydrogenase